MKMKLWVVLPAEPVKDVKRIKCFCDKLRDLEQSLPLSDILKLLRNQEQQLGMCFSEREALAFGEAFEEAEIEWTVEERLIPTR